MANTPKPELEFCPYCGKGNLKGNGVLFGLSMVKCLECLAVFNVKFAGVTKLAKVKNQVNIKKS